MDISKPGHGELGMPEHANSTGRCVAVLGGE